MAGRFTVRCLFTCLGLLGGTAAVQAQFGCNPFMGPVVYYPYPVQQFYYWSPPAVAVAVAHPARATMPQTVASVPPKIAPTRPIESRPTEARPAATQPSTVRPTEYALPQVAQPIPAVPTPAEPTPAAPRVNVEPPSVPPITPPIESKIPPVNPLVIPLGPTDTPPRPGSQTATPPAKSEPIPKPALPTAPLPDTGGYTIPSITPKQSSDGNPKLPPLKLPTSPSESASFFRPRHSERPLRVDVFPVAGHIAERATVGVFNYTEQEIEFTIAGKHHRLPARHCVCLESVAREITWQVNQQPGRQTQLQPGTQGVEIVIRP